MKGSIKIAAMFTGVLSLVQIANAQSNFKVSPEKPKPGDVIKVTYVKAGDLIGTGKSPEAVVYENYYQKDNESKTKVFEPVLVKTAPNTYEAEIKTDTNANFIFINFSVDDKKDNSSKVGYTVSFYNNENTVPYSSYNKGRYLANVITFYGGEQNIDDALVAYADEFTKYPAHKEKLYSRYLSLLMGKDKQKATELAQKEIEASLKDSVITEPKYEYVESLYATLKLPQQRNVITKLKKEKYTDGAWTKQDLLTKFSRESDIEKKEVLLKDILNKIDNDPNWASYKENRFNYIRDLAVAASAQRKAADVERIISTYVTKDIKAGDLFVLNYYMANNLARDTNQLAVAEKYAKQAYENALTEYKNPAPKQEGTSTKDWKEGLESYAIFGGNTYADILNKNKKYKEAYNVAKSSYALTKGDVESLNSNYATAAANTLNAKQLTPLLEGFVKNGTASGFVKEKLKELYTAKNKSDKGYDEYFDGLAKENLLKLTEELKKELISDESPKFALKNFKGEEVSLESLKGKVVVVDFWATWCGPCIASFPNMQKAQNKLYAEANNDVVFLFVNSWENGDNKLKNAQDFMTKNNYNFEVLMDTDNKVIESYKVTGIPTKFIIGKDGKIKFKKVGGGGADKLIDELNIMLELARKSS
ncbi:TlpA family protein disulfide reductase [Polluticaenibacter yanchengensis]|uniref:TlpA disulfide reductase family protein n=1 Tax=Polluticaenibacter yanchengensis TaxID=3014562 RepID=A0ABT4UND7_9BACT|nr:TlpA disulfide reductase family protein [Chitinophagaceae bacterium LY-5]